MEYLTPLSVSIFAALAAALSAVSAWRSSRAARESLRLAKIDFEERHDSIRDYLIDGIAWDSSDGETIASFACTYSNAANSPSTLGRFELVVNLLNEDRTQMSVVLDPCFDQVPPNKNIQQLRVPLNLPARSTESGWISFKIPEHLFKTKRIDKYQITAITSSGKTLSLDCHLLHRTENDNRKN